MTSKNLKTFLDCNTGRFYEFDLNNTIEHIHYDFKDSIDELDDQVPVYPFDYRIVGFGGGKKGFATIITHWREGGKIFGCPSCALHEVHSIELHDGDIQEYSKYVATLIYESESVFYKAILNVHLPMKVYNHFVKKLTDDGYIIPATISYA